MTCNGWALSIPPTATVRVPHQIPIGFCVAIFLVPFLCTRWHDGVFHGLGTPLLHRHVKIPVQYSSGLQSSWLLLAFYLQSVPWSGHFLYFYVQLYVRQSMLFLPTLGQQDFGDTRDLCTASQFIAAAISPPMCSSNRRGVI